MLANEFRLPISAVCRHCPPSKTAAYRVTIDCDQHQHPSMVMPTLTELFNGLSGDESSIGFMPYGINLPVSIYASKKNNKYRIQSDCFENLYIFVDELIRRIRLKNGNIQFDAALPLDNYFTLIDQHWELIKRKKSLDELLASKSAELRSIAALLLTKFKDSTPTPLAHLDNLFEYSYRQIIAINTNLTQSQDAIDRANAGIAGATRLVLLLVSFGLDAEKSDQLRNAFGVDHVDENWVQHTDRALSYLLGSNSNSTANDDIVVRLKRHVTSICDRALEALARVRSRLTAIPEDTAVEDDETDMPTGSQLGAHRSGTIAPIKDTASDNDDDYSFE